MLLQFFKTSIIFVTKWLHFINLSYPNFNLTTMNNTNDLSQRTLRIQRTFSAPVQLVWEAWSKPEHITQWWGPKNMETSVIEHNFQVGGKWHYSMKMPDGNSFIAEGIYSVIEALRRIVSSANFKPMTEGVEMQVLFEAQGERQTQMTFNMIHPTAEYCKQQEQMGFYKGWASVFDRLEAFLD